MSHLNQLIQEKFALEQEASRLTTKFKDIEFRRRVAEVEGVSEKMASVSAEVTVLTQMINETTTKLQKINLEIDVLQRGYNKKVEKLGAFSAITFLVSFYGFSFDDMKYGIIWFFIWIFISVVLKLKKSDEKALASGLTEEQIKQIKINAREKANKEENDRNALAKAIKDEFRR
jgi:hypothetical protein